MRPSSTPRFPQDGEAVAVLARVQKLLQGQYREANDHQHHGPVEHGSLQDKVSGFRAVHLQGAQPDGIGYTGVSQLRVLLGKGLLQFPGVVIGDGFLRGDVAVAHHREQLFTDTVREDIEDIRVGVVGRSPPMESS